MNPENDRGQIEGAMVTGLGYMLTEQIVWDKETGKMVTDSTWVRKGIVHDIQIE